MKTLKEFCIENNLDLDKYEKWVLRQTYCSITSSPPKEIITTEHIFEYDCKTQMYRFKFHKNNSYEYVMLDVQRNRNIYTIKYPNCRRLYELKNNHILYFVIELNFD